MTRKPQILLANDGIFSPGLWAAAETLSRLGFVTVAAPREQASGAGRSVPATSDGIIREETVEVNGQQWKAYAVGGTPAQTVLHAILEIMPQKPDLVVSGINYGENVSASITSSGTVGAAMEGASMGIPSLAVSLQTEVRHHYSNSAEVDFSAAAHFTALFGRLLLERPLPPGVDLIKVDVPSDANPETAWAWTRLSPGYYYWPIPAQRSSWDIPGKLGYEMKVNLEAEPHDTDVYTLLKERLVSVTPLTLDMTAKVDSRKLDEFAR
jgi:5'-nucleotidase